MLYETESLFSPSQSSKSCSSFPKVLVLEISSFLPPQSMHQHQLSANGSELV